MKTKIIPALILACSFWVAPAIQAEIETIDPVQVWTKNCKKCHGEEGKGDTKIGQKFGVQDYSDPKVQAKFTDEEIIKVTKEGVIDEKGKKLMPPYADKLTDKEIEAMVPLIRSFQKK